MAPFDALVVTLIVYTIRLSPNLIDICVNPYLNIRLCMYLTRIDLSSSYKRIGAQ